MKSRRKGHLFDIIYVKSSLSNTVSILAHFLCESLAPSSRGCRQLGSPHGQRAPTTRQAVPPPGLTARGHAPSRQGLAAPWQLPTLRSSPSQRLLSSPGPSFSAGPSPHGAAHLPRCAGRADRAHEGAHRWWRLLSRIWRDPDGWQRALACREEWQRGGTTLRRDRLPLADPVPSPARLDTPARAPSPWQAARASAQKDA